MDIENKSIKSYDTEWEVLEGSREVISVISAEVPDRHGDVVLASSFDKDSLKNFMKNPLVLDNHNHDSDPVGVCKWIKVVGKTIVAKTYFPPTGRSDEIFKQFQNNQRFAFSIGFMKKDYNKPTRKELNLNPEWEGCMVVRKIELLEYSPVQIPANQEALVMAVAKKFDKEEPVDKVVNKYLGLLNIIKNMDVKSIVER